MGFFDFLKKKIKAKKAFTHDKGQWQWDGVYEAFCEKNDADELTEEQEEKMWRYACSHITYFITWIIRRDFFNIQIEWDTEKVKEIKEGKGNPTDFVIDSLDCQFARYDLKEEIYDFIDEYYDSKYLEDYCKFVEETLNKEIYEIEFDWEDYPLFEKMMDENYKKYKESLIEE